MREISVWIRLSKLMLMVSSSSAFSMFEIRLTTNLPVEEMKKELSQLKLRVWSSVLCVPYLHHVFLLITSKL